jgi:hypothetical protein
VPVGLAWFRAHFEKQGYAESIRAAAEVHGLAHVEQPNSATTWSGSSPRVVRLDVAVSAIHRTWYDGCGHRSARNTRMKEKRA